MNDCSERWRRCVQHRSAAFVEFAKSFFGEKSRQLLIVAGGGFDPRAITLPNLISPICRKQAYAIIVREHRLKDSDALQATAIKNTQKIGALFEKHAVTETNMFATDGKLIGGREIVGQLRKNVDIDSFTDLVVDFSALSRGIGFTIVRYFYDLCRERSRQGRVNLHLIVDDRPGVDQSIVSEASDRVEPIHGFRGKWGLDSERDAAKLWLPQLGPGQHVPAVLTRIHTFVEPDAVCPILPFPADNLRMGDELIWKFRTQIKDTWSTDDRDLLYTHEHRPLDLYRTILRIDRIRSRVFQEVGGSMTILSAVGRKMLATGVLMAALDRNFPVMHVESVGYHAKAEGMPAFNCDDLESLTHIWLCGECYPTEERK